MTKNNHRFYVYIDEAGDDGIGKFRELGEPGQSHWLCLAALIVSSENNSSILDWRNEITSSMPNKKRKDIHFEDLNHDQRVFSCGVISKKPVGLVCVLSNKKTLIGHKNILKFKEKNHLYKYVLRYLLERVTAAVARKCVSSGIPFEPAKIIFSRRGGMDYEDFKDYLKSLKTLQSAAGSWHHINWDCIDIDSIEAQDHSKLAGLQLVDVVASAFHKAVEPNSFGNFETRYAQALRSKVLKDTNGAWLDFGVKPIPSLPEMRLSGDQTGFFNSWKKNGQTPSS